MKECNVFQIICSAIQEALRESSGVHVPERPAAHCIMGLVVLHFLDIRALEGVTERLKTSNPTQRCLLVT